MQNAIKETKDRLLTLKEADKQAKEQLKSGDLGQDAYNALQREIIETEQRLKSLENTAGSASAKLLKISKVTGDFGEKATQLGQSFLPVTAAITGLGAASVKAMDNVDEGLDIIVQKTGATGQAMEELKAVFDNVAQEVPGEFEDIGAAIGEINTRLDFTGDKLEGASKQFLKFAKVNDMDVNTSVQLVTRAMGDAGIEADRYGELLDMLTVAGQKSGISIEALTQNLAKYGAPLRALGIDTENAIALFAGWEKAGVNTEIAFSGMKKAISNWGKAGKDANVEFAKVMQEIKNAPSIADATALAIEAFGAKAGPDLADAIQGGRFEVEEYMKALQTAGGVVDQTYSGIVDAVDDTQLAMQTAQLALHDIGETIMKTLGPILLSLAKKLKEIGDWFSNLSPAGKKVVLMIAGLIAAIGPLLLIIGKLATGISTVTQILSKTHGATKLLKTGFSAMGGPVLAVVAVVGTLVAAFKHLWDTNEGFRNAITEIWERISSVFAGFVDGIKERLSALGISFEDITAGISAIWNGFCDLLAPVFEGAFNQIATIFETVLGVITGILDIFTGLFTGDWELFWKGVDEIFSSIINGVKNAFENVLNTLKGIADVFCNWFGTTWENVWTGIKNFFSNIWTGIKDFFKNTVENIKNGAINGFNAMKDGIKSTCSKIATAVKDGFNAAIDFITSLPGKALQWGKDFVNGLINGIKSMIGKVVDTVKGIANKITSFLHFSRPDEGPLREYEKWMPDFIDGLADGIKSNAYKVTDAVKGLSANMDVKANMQEGTNTVLYDTVTGKNILDLLARYIPMIAESQDKMIVLNDGTLVGKMMPKINQSLNQTRINNERGRTC